ncbi:MAG: pyridoxal phosphate-dependent aminotransferase [Chitinophagaceae bacterium]
MKIFLDRRLWLKQSTLALAGLGLTPAIFAKDPKNSFQNYKLQHSPNDTILLNSNENAYGPSPAARKAILENYLISNRYPDDIIPVLRKKIAMHWNVAEENILLGAGSSEIIGLTCLHVSKTKGDVITTEPSYKVWNNQASAFGLNFKRNPLPRNVKQDVEKLYGPITSETRMIYICNPNNPTGTVLDRNDVEQYAINASKQTIVFIDEAYAEYAQLKTLAPTAVNNPNIIVAKTFSKVYGLAGARIGYAIAHPQTIKTLSSYQPWPDSNVSAVSATAAIASIADQTFVQDCIDKTNKAKKICYDTFLQLRLDYIPSSTNFILFNIDKVAENFSQGMKSKNIQVQFREHYDGKWCRVTMGTIEEMQEFTKALKEIAA